MKEPEFKELKINDVIYHKETNNVVCLTSQFSPTKGELDPKDSLSVKGYDNTPCNDIQVINCDMWERVSEESPDAVKLHITIIRLAQLEHFVYSRLR